jgi:hypothetical protein
VKHTKAAAAIAIAAGAMSAGVAHAVGGPDHPTGNQGQHGLNGTDTQHGNTGTHGNSGTHGPGTKHHSSSGSHGCRYRNVAFVAKGILDAPAPTFSQQSDGTWNLSDMSVTFNGGNRFGRFWNNLSSPFSLDGVRVVFALADTQPDGNVDQNDVVPGDQVQLIGKLRWRPARCEPTVTTAGVTTGTDTTTTGTDTTTTGTDTTTTGTDTNTASTPTTSTVQVIEPVIRKVIFKDPANDAQESAERDTHGRPPQSTTGTDTTETETDTTSSTDTGTSTETVPTVSTPTAP